MPNSRAARTTAVGRLIVKAFQRADRGEQQRQPQPAPEPLDRRVDPAHVAQHARTERDLIEGETVAAQRGFGLGGADDVVPVVLVEVLPRLGDDLVQGLEIDGGGGEAPVGGLFGILLLHERYRCKGAADAAREGLYLAPAARRAAGGSTALSSNSVVVSRSSSNQAVMAARRPSM